MDKVIIGGGQGFWGDSNDAAIHMVHTAPLDYMACDYLAELTMSILARQEDQKPRGPASPGTSSGSTKPAARRPSAKTSASSPTPAA